MIGRDYNPGKPCQVPQALKWFSGQKRVVDARRIAELRAQAAGRKKISREEGIGVGTLYRLAREGSKIREKVF